MLTKIYTSQNIAKLKTVTGDWFKEVQTNPLDSINLDAEISSPHVDLDEDITLTETVPLNSESITIPEGNTSLDHSEGKLVTSVTLEH